MSGLYAVIGFPNVSSPSVVNYNDYFVCDLYDDCQVGDLQQAENVKKELDAMYSKDYDYRVVKISFLD